MLEAATSPLDYHESVIVCSKLDTVSANVKFLGSFQTNMRTPSTELDFEDLVELTKLEARKIGANVIRIRSVRYGNACRGISGYLYSLPSTESQSFEAKIIRRYSAHESGSNLIAYRPTKYGLLVSYKLHVDQSTIGKIRPESVLVGSINPESKTVWAKTETKAELSISSINNQPIYIRCGITTGLFVGRPTLELMDPQVANLEISLME